MPSNDPTSARVERARRMLLCALEVDTLEELSPTGRVRVEARAVELAGFAAAEVKRALEAAAAAVECEGSQVQLRGGVLVRAVDAPWLRARAATEAGDE
jgi:hypothetical protein